MIQELAWLSILVILSYLLGSVPPGAILAWLFGKNILLEGSGKTGTANTLNTIGPVFAAIAFLFDFAKGAVSVLLPLYVLSPGTLWSDTGVALCGASCIIGHNRSVWIRLFAGRWGGGRGIVPAIGAAFVTAPIPALVAGAVGLLALLVLLLLPASGPGKPPARFAVKAATYAGLAAGCVSGLASLLLGAQSVASMLTLLMWCALVWAGFAIGSDRFQTAA